MASVDRHPVALLETQCPAIVSDSELELHSSGFVGLTLNGDINALKVSVANASTTVDAESKNLELRTGKMNTHSDITEIRAPGSISIRTGGHGVNDPASVLTADATTSTLGSGENGAGAYLTTTNNAVSLAAQGQEIVLANPGRVSFRAGFHAMLIQNDEILRVENDRVAIHRDVDVHGTLNNISGSSATLQVADSTISVATSTPLESGVQGSQTGTGVIVDTVPGSASDVSFISQFKKADGTSIFIDGDGAVDVAKGVSSTLFNKHVVHRVGGGAKLLGQRTPDSRSSGPAWDIQGGALRLRRVVPDPAGGGNATEYAVSMRVSDTGSFEVVQIKILLTYNGTEQKYARGTPEVSVLQQGLVA